MRGLPLSFPKHAVRANEPTEPIDIAKAQKQHEAYRNALENLKVRVTELPADEAQPDCCFIEDTAVVIGNTALVTHLGHPSRKKESDVTKAALEKLGGFCVRDLHTEPSDAAPQEPITLDGGDVMFTGRDVIVGTSDRSSPAGVAILSNAFDKDYSVMVLPVTEGLHLKSRMSFVGSNTIVIAGGDFTASMRSMLKCCFEKPYELLLVPDPPAANVLYVNGTLLIRSREEFPGSAAKLHEWANRNRVPVVELNFSEFHKADGALTCCSILLP